ncbi:hypothetical protein GCM10029992_45860 [Glycomyces albus]
MPQGVVPAGTQAMPRSEFDSPPAAERDWPAPREAEEPGRSPVVPIVLTALGVVILVFAAVWLWPDDGDDRAGSQETADTTQQTEDEQSPEDEVEETTGDDSDDEQEEDQAQETSDEEEQPDPGDHTLEEPQGVAVPGVTGRLLADAVGALNEAGFQDVGWTAEPEDELLENENSGSCLVETQTPTSEDGEKDPDNTRVELTYWDDGSGCGMDG